MSKHTIIIISIIFFSYCFICVRNPKVKNPGTIIGNFFLFLGSEGGWICGKSIMLILSLILIAVTAEEVFDCKVCSVD